MTDLIPPDEWLRSSPDPLSSLRIEQQEILKRGERVIDLSMINPNLEPPRMLLDKLLEAITKPNNQRYAVSRGIRRLREAFSSKYSQAFGVNLDPEKEVCVTFGSKDALLCLLRAKLKPGDKVLTGCPTYPAYLSAIRMVGAAPVFFDISDDSEKMLSDIKARLERFKPSMLLLNFPNNPTGIAVDETFFKKLVKICESNGVAVVNDFVYGEMVYGANAAPSLLSVGDLRNCTEIYSLSKAYSVPGWRVGALLGCTETIKAVSKMKSLIDYGIYLPIQHAAAAALSSADGICRPAVAQYERRGKVLVSGLRRLGWTAQQPTAGACVWAKPPAVFGEKDWVRELLISQHVLVTPGSVFGDSQSGWVRFALVGSEQDMREVLARLEKFAGTSESQELKQAAGVGV